jgi:hypothetical protein
VKNTFSIKPFLRDRLNRELLQKGQLRIGGMGYPSRRDSAEDSIMSPAKKLGFIQSERLHNFPRMKCQMRARAVPRPRMK